MVLNHYQVLGIPEDADSRQIKSAYRSMAKRFHPDTNRGSEAAAELFRKLNEAYRVLGDEHRRRVYDLEIGRQRKAEQERNAAARKQAAKQDPQQKFNHFLYSVLGAILETPDPPTQVHPPPASPPVRPQRKPKKTPDFDFYYYLAMERQNSPYQCDDDGICRRTSKRKPGFVRSPAGGLLLVLFSGLWELFR